MKKLAVIISVIVFVIFGYRFLTIDRLKQENGSESQNISQKSTEVKVIAASDSRLHEVRNTYIGTAEYQNSINVTAQTSGTITSLSVKVGDTIKTGSLIAIIDATRKYAQAGDNNLSSSSVRQLEIALDIAKKSYKIASDTYKKNKTYANKKSKEIAKLAVDAAESNLNGTLDAHMVTAPKSGILTSVFVNAGDSVMIGTPLFSLSENNLITVRFFVNNEEARNIQKNAPVSILYQKKRIDAKIRTVLPVADSATGRFLVETYAQKETGILSGSAVEVEYTNTISPSNSNHLFLPISALSINQNGNFVFIEENGTAREIPIEIYNIVGETAEIYASLDPDARIIIEGGKLLENGFPVRIIE